MKEKTRTVTTTYEVTEYQCDLCDFTDTSEVEIKLHNIEHLPIKKEVYDVDDSKAGNVFFKFQSEEDYNAFLEAAESGYDEYSEYLGGGWQGPGWYGSLREHVWSDEYRSILYPVNKIIKRIETKQQKINMIFEGLKHRFN
jgi:hypothetical protein